ncbi:MAG: HAMP domain-containing protein, partial [Chthoniobacterales bacterium]|nr:HAMP domain-containing protein [Chthoniobacterales bacterium]
MKEWWQQRSLRVKLAGWFAGTGVVVWVLCLMAALITGVWQPRERAIVLEVLAVGLPAAGLLFAVAGYFVAGRLLWPIQRIIDRMNLLSAVSLCNRLPISNPHDEIGRLATAINQLLQRLENSFGELKRFTADASHELRTPLSAMRAVGEVGLRDKNPAALQDVIGSMLEEAERMNQLLDRLLLLSRMEGGAEAVQLESVGVRGLLEEVADSFALIAEEK